MKLLALLALTVAAVGAFRYDGYRVLDVGPVNDVSLAKMIANLADNDERLRDVILMNEHVIASQVITLAVSPKALSNIVEFLESRQIQYTVANEDLQKSFDLSAAENEAAIARWKNSNARDAPTAYISYADQSTWLRNTAALSPIASIFSIGNSYQGRDTIGISINANSNNLPGVWIDCNIHAREWITSASCLHVIDTILTSNSADAIRMRNNYRWYIVPNANPDGYEFSRTSDRMWRKTRSPNTGSACVGTDPNRNFAEGWGGSGASALPCADDYRGSAAFSEVETRNMRDYISRVASFTNVMISVHAYSQLWLVPWGGQTSKPSDYSELMRVGNLAATAIRNTNGLTFQVGTPPDLLYVASGGSFDYTKAQLNIKYSYSPELRPANAAQGGFDIPASNIQPSGNELFASFVATVTNAQHKL